MDDNKNKPAVDALFQMAKAYEELIGTDETIHLLNFLTSFAVKNPTTVLELAVEVKKDPESFLDIVTPESILKFKQMIKAVKEGGLSGIISALS